MTMTQADDEALLPPCTGSPGLFFPPNESREPHAWRKEREARAKALCAQCSVRLDCATRAFITPEEHGVWGGMTEVERRRAMKVPTLKRTKEQARAFRDSLPLDECRRLESRYNRNIRPTEDEYLGHLEYSRRMRRPKRPKEQGA
jgi:WhiB family redox-sensing transcriptional regulator